MDDESTVLRWLGRALGAYGYDVLEFSDPEVALNSLKSEKVDALILDIRLAGKRSGLEILEFVRFHPHLADLPVIMLTGASQLTSAEEETIRRYRAYVFYKPEGANVIVATLDRLLWPTTMPRT